MRSKFYIVASLITLGLSALALLAYQRFRNIDLDRMSDEWLGTTEFHREAFMD